MLMKGHPGDLSTCLFTWYSSCNVLVWDGPDAAIYDDRRHHAQLIEEGKMRRIAVLLRFGDLLTLTVAWVR